MRKRFSVLAASLCAVMMVGSLSVTAYAGGGDEYIEETTPPEQIGGVNWEGLDPVEPGEGFSEDGTLVTRDLLYDKHTNKQFVTVQTSGGSTFYIVIDYDKPVNEEEEQYQTYFFSVVDEADLLAAMEAAGMERPACACSVKCAAGAINTDCPVCAANMTECVGTAPEPEPTPDPEPVPEPEGSTNLGPLLLIAAVALIGGGAGWYFKIYRPKHQRAEQPEEDYGDELDDYDDTPPWDEDESTEDDA
ncbi:TPA: DUF4366 domain-containing protein [Clostridioides difficile]|nr:MULTISPECIES: DUF4366 domain-containing protein [Clostridia]AXU77901.1 SH3 type 3 domain-containing protein [Clostridioides difficile]EGT4235975.1 DUF4366 domain-containing protein [Clostridioides difficile]ELC8372725.1 DUF4366 domain-containing protein [Clostridium perfringens]ELC8374616.1 DUF4366 domain-containing protein [Clostridium perfringens]EQF54917.1 hypothetical protein QGA_1762 [Clostridioides difficile CD181]